MKKYLTAEDYIKKHGIEEVYVCCACGKVSLDNLGNHKLHWGWDESCMLNSVKANTSSLEYDYYGKVRAIDDGGSINENN